MCSSEVVSSFLSALYEANKGNILRSNEPRGPYVQGDGPIIKVNPKEIRNDLYATSLDYLEKMLSNEKITVYISLSAAIIKLRMLVEEAFDLKLPDSFPKDFLDELPNIVLDMEKKDIFDESNRFFDAVLSRIDVDSVIPIVYDGDGHLSKEGKTLVISYDIALATALLLYLKKNLTEAYNRILLAISE